MEQEANYMEETLDYIDRYFRGDLPAGERLSFEQRCESDQVFAESVSFYVATRQQLRTELHVAKREEFAELYKSLSASEGGKVRSMSPVRRLMPYFSVAAACILLLAGWWFFFTASGPRKLAGDYMNANFAALSGVMGSSVDSLHQGMAAYNKGDRAQATTIFRALVQDTTQESEARKYLGICYLTAGDYDKALVQFDSLSLQQGLQSNPGLFYKALTLMKRSSGDDRQEAKKLLQVVLDKKLSGSEDAAIWIKNL